MQGVPRSVRDLLRNYPVLKASIKAYHLQRQALLEQTRTSPIVVVHKDKAPSNPTARKAEHLEELEERYRYALAACRAIDLALDGMDRETRKIVKLRYFEGMRVNEIARKLHYGRQTIERRLRRGEGIVYVMALNFPEVAQTLQDGTCDPLNECQDGEQTAVRWRNLGGISDGRE
ncbi:MAG TPA: hypothetical protein GX510_10100 [Firmicutes bacterium]|nr:hypothetical protein [Candidatus Fermentithermobacillaceae bacterium]